MRLSLGKFQSQALWALALILGLLLLALATKSGSASPLTPSAISPAAYHVA